MSKTDAPPKVAVAPPILMLWALAVVGAASFAGALIGLGLGVLVGTLLPSYYRAVFATGDAPDFEPLAVGAGLGLTQGFAGGAFIGVAVVALYFWMRSRTS